MPMLNFINSMICLLTCKYDSVWQEIRGEYSGTRPMAFLFVYKFMMNWQVLLHGTGRCKGLYQFNIRILSWHDKQAMDLFLIYQVFHVIITSWLSLYIWMNTIMEFKYFESYSRPNYLLKMFYSVGWQYTGHTLARIVAKDNIFRVKISSWRQYIL